jgi:hypothetical protein
MNFISLKNFNKLSILNNSYNTTISTTVLQYYLYNYHYYICFPFSTIMVYQLSKKFNAHNILINLIRKSKQYIIIYIHNKKNIIQNNIELSNINAHDTINNKDDSIVENKTENKNENESILYYYLSYFNPFSYTIYKSNQIQKLIIENKKDKQINNDEKINNNYIYFDKIEDAENNNSYFNKFLHIFSYNKNKINKSNSEYSIETHIELCHKCSENEIENTLNGNCENCEECNKNENKIYILKKSNK